MIKPNAKKLLVLPDPKQEKSAGGIILAKSSIDTEPEWGTVVAIPLEGASWEINVGDRVLYGVYEGVRVKLDGKEHLVMKEESIWLVEHVDPVKK